MITFYHYIDPLVVEPSTTRTISSKSTAELQKEIDVLQGKLEVPTYSHYNHRSLTIHRIETLICIHFVPCSVLQDRPGCKMTDQDAK